MMFTPRFPAFLLAAFMMMLTSSVMAAEKMPSPSQGDQVVVQAWDLFTEGCIRNASNLSPWVEQFDQLTRADIDAVALPALGRTLGYPARDKTRAAWRLRNSHTLLLQLDNSGCTVAHEAYIPPDTLRQMVSELAKRIQSIKRAPVSVDQKDGTGGQFMVLIKSEAKEASGKGEPTRYMLFVTSPNSSTGGIRTVMHSFRSSADFKL